MAVEPRTESITEQMLLTLDNEGFVEVVQGELVEMGPAGGRHGKIAGNVLGPLWLYVNSNDLGVVFADQTTCVLEGTPEELRTVRVPDVAFIQSKNLPDEIPEGYFYQPPDLAVEVVSPHERIADTQAKLNDYFESGTEEVWVAFPAQAQIVVHRAGAATTFGKDDTLTSEALLPDFALKLSDVFD